MAGIVTLPTSTNLVERENDAIILMNKSKID